MIPKFRAWDKRHKRLVNVYIIDFKNSLLVTENGEIAQLAFFEIMQSTGINDQAGNEIFEGDILLRTTESINYSDSYTHSYVEAYRMNTGAYRIKGKHIHDTELISYRKNLLVVGNIYENLELLDKPYYVSEGGGEMRAV